ncbi:MAG TPA: hypothetical protein VFY85_03005 [Gemmatimonadaceae bacterium]|nr:hypothetical protein [Gemmatimonadaceae bacterium]
MPSRADWRRWAEWALRLALVVVLAIALGRSMRAARPGAVSLSARASTLGEALQRATSTGRIGALDVDVDGALSPAERAWLAALRRAGVQVSWQGDVPAMALSVERSREPVARAQLRMVSDGAGMLVLRDSVGVLDSVQAARGAAVEAADVVGRASVQQARFSATSPVPARIDRRAVLVLGRAGWESRFVLAALGEAGWQARGRLPVAPGVSVVDAAVLPLDTARYDVVIALDSTAADLAPAVAKFVAQGGGAIIAGSALDAGALRGIAPARAGARRPGRILLEGDTLTRADLPVRPLVAPRGDAVPLERQPAGLVVAVRRAGRGRVAAVGYDESWRWRMQGGAAGEAAHRDWWSRMTGLVAPERVPSDSDVANRSGAAPRADLLAALGEPADSSARREGASSSRLPVVLLVLALVALLAETASRRFRGAS